MLKNDILSATKLCLVTLKAGGLLMRSKNLLAIFLRCHTSTSLLNGLVTRCIYLTCASHVFVHQIHNMAAQVADQAEKKKCRGPHLQHLSDGSLLQNVP